MPWVRPIFFYIFLTEIRKNFGYKIILASIKFMLIYDTIYDTICDIILPPKTYKNCAFHNTNPTTNSTFSSSPLDSLLHPLEGLTRSVSCLRRRGRESLKNWWRPTHSFDTHCSSGREKLKRKPDIQSPQVN